MGDVVPIRIQSISLRRFGSYNAGRYPRLRRNALCVQFPTPLSSVGYKFGKRIPPGSGCHRICPLPFPRVSRKRGSCRGAFSGSARIIPSLSPQNRPNYITTSQQMANHPEGLATNGSLRGGSGQASAGSYHNRLSGTAEVKITRNHSAIAFSRG